jgi:zinc protease
MQPLLERKEVHTEISGKSQSDIVLGWPSISKRDPDFHKAYLANCVLGQFGMMGRIGQHVREEQGLAYYVYTSLDAGIGPGPWVAVAGVAPKNVDPAIEAMMAQILRMRTELVGEQELADNKAFIVDSLPLRLEGNEGIAAQIVNMELFGLGLDYLKRFPGIIESITADDIRAIAERVMAPEAYVLSVAGPAS